MLRPEVRRIVIDLDAHSVSAVYGLPEVRAFVPQIQHDPAAVKPSTDGGEGWLDEYVMRRMVGGAK